MEIKLSQKKLVVILFFVVMIGGFLRFYNNTKNPVSLNIDEVSIGYNAFSILKTGRDEYGSFLPIAFKSVGDYKPGGLIYLTVPSVAIFGLNEFGVRFPTAFISTLSLIIFYLLFKALTKNDLYALLGTIFLTISPWHIYYSRYASESMVATAFFGLGFWSFLKINQKKWYWIILSALALSFSVYTYHSYRLFVPLFFLFLLTFKWKEIWQNKKPYLVWIFFCLIICLPLIYSVLFGPAETRAGMTFITNDIEFTRQIRLYDYSNLNKIGNFFTNFFDNYNFLLIFYWVRKYLNYLDPGFLFYSGLSLTRDGSLGLGVVYLFELPCIVLGSCFLFRSKTSSKWVVLAWILIGLIPASLTVNEQHPLRTLIIAPALELISAIGAIQLINIFKKRAKVERYIAYFSLSALVLFCFLWAFLAYVVHFPREKGEAFMEGTKEAALYASENKNKYKEVIFDPVRGIEGPYIVNIPHMYILFYSAFDPKTYQDISKKQVTTKESSSYSFDKYTIMQIDWNKERVKKGNLLIGSPWSLPEQDVPENQILERVYLTNGKLAYLIVKT